VSEVKYITVEAAQVGRAEISLKGKIRAILLPGKLCRKLLKYTKKKKIVSGDIFLTRNGKGLSRRQIWAEMKAICEQAGVAPSKVFPHNLCLPSRFTGYAAMWCNWRMCWDTPAWRPPASIWYPPAPNTS